MTMQIKAALALMVGLGIVNLGTAQAQTKAPAAYWVTEVLEMSDQASFIKAVQAVPATLQPFGGRYIVLGGKIVPDKGSPPSRITIVQFDSFEKAQQWISDPAASAARDEVNKYAKTRNYTVEGVAN